MGPDDTEYSRDLQISHLETVLQDARIRIAELEAENKRLINVIKNSIQAIEAMNKISDEMTVLQKVVRFGKLLACSEELKAVLREVEDAD